MAHSSAPPQQDPEAALDGLVPQIPILVRLGPRGGLEFAYQRDRGRWAIPSCHCPRCSTASSSSPTRTRPKGIKPSSSSKSDRSPWNAMQLMRKSYKCTNSGANSNTCRCRPLPSHLPCGSPSRKSVSPPRSGLRTGLRSGLRSSSKVRTLHRSPSPLRRPSPHRKPIHGGICSAKSPGHGPNFSYETYPRYSPRRQTSDIACQTVTPEIFPKASPIRRGLHSDSCCCDPPSHKLREFSIAGFRSNAMDSHCGCHGAAPVVAGGCRCCGTVGQRQCRRAPPHVTPEEGPCACSRQESCCTALGCHRAAHSRSEKAAVAWNAKCSNCNQLLPSHQAR